MPTDSDHHLTTIGIECESLADRGGVARMVQRTLQELACRPELAAHYRFRLYSRDPLPDGPWLTNPLFEQVVVRPFPRWVFPLGSFPFYHFAWLPLRLWWDRLTRGLDVMYYPNYMLPIIHPPMVASVVMLTEDVFREMRDTTIPLRYRIAYYVFTLGMTKHFATRVMAISQSSCAALQQEGIAPSRIVVNPLAVDTPTAVQPMDGTYLLFVGQAFERRHLREALLAFESLAQHNRTLRFIAIGPDKYRTPTIAPLVTQINTRLGRPAVQHIARVSDEDLARFYAGARAVVYVSDLEAFGLPPLEALSYGSIAVVMDTPVNREIYGSDGACYATEGSVAAIRTALETALTDTTRRQHITDASSAILARYTWQAHTDRFLRILTELCAS